MKRVISYTGSQNDPSSRFRIRQHLPYLKSHNLTIHDSPSVVGRYPPRETVLRYPWGVSNLVSGFFRAIQSNFFDITIIQREFLSTMFTNERFLKGPKILDVDDAIFVYSMGKTAKELASLSDLIICGNDFLGEWFSQYNKNIRVIPTAVDSSRFRPGEYISEQLVIGWSGSSSGYKYLYEIEDELITVLANFPSCKIRIVSDQPPLFKKITGYYIEYFKWTTENEVSLLQEMTVGIMPLTDSIWERGKCSFKMLTYMACGVPVVVSPVGMNNEVMALGNVGLFARDGQWATAITDVLNNGQKAKEMGNAGRLVVEKNFDNSIIGQKLYKSIISLC